MADGRSVTSLLAPLRWLALACALSTGMAAAQQTDGELNARTMAIAQELRCLVCQNQSLADSHAGLALDLRAQIEDQLRQGRSRQQILDYMTERYGSFILYKPPVQWSTLLLWLGPGLLLALAFTGFWLQLRRRQSPASPSASPMDRTRIARLLEPEARQEHRP